MARLPAPWLTLGALLASGVVMKLMPVPEPRIETRTELVATTVLHTPSLAVPSVVYALLMNVGAFALIAFGRRWTATTVGAASAPNVSALTR